MNPDLTLINVNFMGYGNPIASRGLLNRNFQLKELWGSEGVRGKNLKVSQLQLTAAQGSNIFEYFR